MSSTEAKDKADTSSDPSYALVRPLIAVLCPELQASIARTIPCHNLPSARAGSLWQCLARQCEQPQCSERSNSRQVKDLLLKLKRRQLSTTQVATETLEALRKVIVGTKGTTPKILIEKVLCCLLNTGVSNLIFVSPS
mgnify:CR=1 FL=1|jgi:hypothetical protein